MHTTIVTHHRRSRARRGRGERGIGLVMATFMIATLLVAITGALMTGAANSRAATNYRSAAQAHFVAESGISHALQTINAIGAVNYQNEIVNNWSTMWGNGAKTFSSTSVPGYTYTVTNTAGATPASTGRLVATATQKDANNNVIATNSTVANLLRDRRWRDLDRAANLAYEQQPADPADDAFLEAAARVAFVRLDRDEAAAGFGPWEPGPDGQR